MLNEEKDRHVIGQVVKCNVEIILTYNLKDFPEHSIKPLNSCVKTPDE